MTNLRFHFYISVDARHQVFTVHTLFCCDRRILQKLLLTYTAVKLRLSWESAFVVRCVLIYMLCVLMLSHMGPLSFVFHRNNRIPSTAVSDVSTFFFVYVPQCLFNNWRILPRWFHVIKPIISNFNDSLVLSVIFLLCWLCCILTAARVFLVTTRSDCFFLSPSNCKWSYQIHYAA